MALTTCRECGSPVSTQAAACPKCGAPVRNLKNGRRKSNRTILAYAAVCAGILSIIIMKLMPALPLWIVAIIFLIACGGAYSAFLQDEANRRIIDRD